MAITLLQSSTSGSITSSGAGNLLVVWQILTTSAPTDNLSSTYTVVSVSNSPGIASIGYLLSTASGITTVTAGSGGTIIAVAEFTGGTFSFDTSKTGTGAAWQTCTNLAGDGACYWIQTTATATTSQYTWTINSVGQISSVTAPTSFTMINSSTGSGAKCTGVRGLTENTSNTSLTPAGNGEVLASCVDISTSKYAQITAAFSIGGAPPPATIFTRRQRGWGY